MEARDPALRRRLGLLPAIVVLGVLFGGALAGVVRASLVPLEGGVSFEAWRDLFDEPAFGEAVRFTAQVTLLATAASAAVALALVAILRARGVTARVLLALPVPVPHLAVGALAVLWLAPGGLADRILGGVPVDVVHDSAGLGIVLVYVYKEAPFLALIVLAACGRDLADREEAAAVLGLSPWQRLRWVTWPAVRRPLLLGSIMVAGFVAGSVEIPLLVGPTAPPTLPLFAYQSTQGDAIAGAGPAAAALLVVTAFALLLAAALARLARDEGRPG